MEPVAIWMALRGKRPSLRRGDEGEDVRELQEKLASFGYSVGEIDGRFGYLTEDALMEFQRDHRLRVDGIAGPQVWAALDAGVPRRRLVHEVKPGERLADLADRYGISPDAIRWMNGMSRRGRLVPGKRLVLRRSSVVAGVPAGLDAVGRRTLALEGKRLSAAALYGLAIGRDGAVEGAVDEGARELAREGGWPPVAALRHGEGGDLAGALASRRRRRRLLASLKALTEKEGWAGFLLDVGPVPLGRGAGLSAGLAQLRRAFPRLGLAVAVAPPPEGWRELISDFDYGKLSRLADRVVLALHRWDCLLSPSGETPRRERVEAWVARMSRAVPPWKVLLGVPMGACRIEGPGRFVEVGYRSAAAAGAAARRRPEPDENGFLRLKAGRGDARATFVMAGRDALTRWAALAFRYRLAGLYLHPVGQEDRRLWDVIWRRVWPAGAKSNREPGGI